MGDYTVKVLQKDNKTPISGVSVKSTYSDWLGASHTFEVFTDANGEAPFNIDVRNGNISVTASKGLSVDKGTIFMGILGDANPKTLVLNLTFNPTTGITDVTNSFLKNVSGKIDLLIIAGIIVSGVILVVYVNSGTKKSIKVTPKTESKTESKTETKIEAKE